MTKQRRSFFERLMGTDDVPERVEEERGTDRENRAKKLALKKNGKDTEERVESAEESGAEGQLTIDVYQTPDDIIVKTMVAGVRPEDLDISITRDMVTIKGMREEAREVTDDKYFHRELYWGAFSRSVVLPEEVDVESAEATERHGLLIIRLPKIDKHRETKLKVKSN
jgi:HSP20 family protein